MTAAMLWDQLLSIAEKAVWGFPTLFLLVGIGLYFTVRTRFFQFRAFVPMLQHVFGGMVSPKAAPEAEPNRSEPHPGGTVTPFQSLCTALSATIGTGNIAGVAYAMLMGGAGAVFWMWVAAFIGMILKYAECVLAVQFRTVTPCAAARWSIWKRACRLLFGSLAVRRRSCSAFRHWRHRSAWET